MAILSKECQHTYVNWYSYNDERIIYEIYRSNILKDKGNEHQLSTLKVS